jgi:dTDP-4-amino-4,6-dideoxygalactose transaminase
VLTTPLSFYATTQAIVRAGDQPTFIDIEDDGNIDITKANIAWDIALPVHLYGQPATFSQGIKPIIEDAAQGHGLPLRGMVACYSFYPTKNLGAMGQAGALVTNDEDIAARVRMLREYGEIERFVYDHEPWRQGGNFRIDELQAAILRVKLKHFSSWQARRREIAAHYRARLQGYEDIIRIPPSYPGHTFHIFAILVKDRDGLAAYLRERHIQTAIRYPVPMHLQPALRWLALKKGDFPKAEAWCDKVLTLPIYPEMTSNAVDTVAGAVTDWVKKQRSK